MLHNLEDNISPSRPQGPPYAGREAALLEPQERGLDPHGRRATGSAGLRGEPGSGALATEVIIL